MYRLLPTELLKNNANARVQTFVLCERGQMGCVLGLCQGSSLSGLQLEELVNRQHKHDGAAHDDLNGVGGVGTRHAHHGSAAQPERFRLCG